MEHTTEQIIDETRNFFRKVYGWMFLGLIISAAAAYSVFSSPKLYEMIVLNQMVLLFLILCELALVLIIVGAVKKISAHTAIFLFLFYCFLTGLTLSVVFAVYTAQSIGLVFLITAGMFGAMSVYGYFTKTDLTRMGQVLFMGLIGLIIAGLINLFMGNSQLDYIMSFVGVVIFTGLTAYDTQKIRQANIIGNEGTPEDIKESILGALNLYLDFINLFLKLLRLFGKRKR